MLKLLVTAPLLAVVLTGCDAAGDIAGDVIDTEIRNQVTGQCEALASNAGIAAERLTEVCDCTAETFLDDPELTADDISAARIEEIVNTCAQQTGGASDAAASETPVEESGA